LVDLFIVLTIANPRRYWSAVAKRRPLCIYRKVRGRNFPSMAIFSKNSLKLNGAAAFGAEFPHQDSAVPAGLIMAGPAPPTLKRGAIFVCPLRDNSVIRRSFCRRLLNPGYGRVARQTGWVNL